MKLSNSSFLCLDIGTYGVRGFAHTIRDAKIVNSAMHFVKNPDTLFAIKTVIDELDQQLKTHFNSAFITGNFGECDFRTVSDTLTWHDEHKITELDLRHQIAKIPKLQDFYAMHIIPIFYGTPSIKNISSSPIDHIDTSLKSIFSVISYPEEKTRYISDILRRVPIQSSGFLDPTFLQNTIFRKQNERVLFIDLGHEYTTVSIWTGRGPLYFNKIDMAQRDLTNAISIGLNIDENDADLLKISVSSATPNEMDRFTPADSSERFASFSVSDINDIFIPKLRELMTRVYMESEKYIKQYNPQRIILSGGGAEIKNINEFIENIFKLPVENMGDAATINALSQYIWDNYLPDRNRYIMRQQKFQNIISSITKIFHRRKPRRKNRFIPIMPSTLCFNMNDMTTYTLFASGGISMIHVDIMDGFYVDKIAGGINELADIRARTKSHLHVHLMTESPSVWASDAIQAGADTVIISTNTAGVKDAIQIVKNAGKRCGIALNPDSNIEILTPILKQVDEIMVMSVKPGAAGQPFDERALKHIRILHNTRKKHGLKYLISVDGGITPETAKLCWNAGADLLVSGSYLASAPDFPLAVQSLLKK